MNINNANDATDFLNAWGSKMRPGILREAIAGLVMREALMDRPRYSSDEIIDNREAIGVLKLAYFRLTGKAWVPLGA